MINSKTLGFTPDFSLSNAPAFIKSKRSKRGFGFFHTSKHLINAVQSFYRRLIFNKKALFVSLITVCLVLPANPPVVSNLERIHQNGVLRVGISLPNDVHSANIHPSNIMVEVLQTFAKELQVSLQFIALKSSADGRLNTDDALDLDMIVTTNTLNKSQWRYTQPVMNIDHFIVHRKSANLPQSVQAQLSSHQLDGKINQEKLNPLNNQINSGRTPIFELFYLVSTGQLPYTLAYSHEYEVYRHFVDDLSGKSLGPAKQFRWGFRTVQSHDLLNKAEQYIKSLSENNSLTELQARFFWNDPALNQIERRYFLKRIHSRLPKFIDSFQAAEDNTGIDWRLLAAMAYQESHWNPNAKSPTGVGGLMMLTQSTAKEVGINNRMIPSESIQGGAAYFKKQKARLPDFISEPDRTWMALAAYNLGMRTVTKAIERAQYHGDSPTDWFSVQKHLSAFEDEIPSNARAQYLKGAAQGIHYVKNIRLFYDLLQEPNIVKNTESPKPINLAMIKDDIKYYDTP